MFKEKPSRIFIVLTLLIMLLANVLPAYAADTPGWQTLTNTLPDGTTNSFSVYGYFTQANSGELVFIVCDPVTGQPAKDGNGNGTAYVFKGDYRIVTKTVPGDGESLVADTAKGPQTITPVPQTVVELSQACSPIEDFTTNEYAVSPWPNRIPQDEAYGLFPNNTDAAITMVVNGHTVTLPPHTNYYVDMGPWKGWTDAHDFQADYINYGYNNGNGVQWGVIVNALVSKITGSDVPGGEIDNTAKEGDVEKGSPAQNITVQGPCSYKFYNADGHLITNTLSDGQTATVKDRGLAWFLNAPANGAEYNFNAQTKGSFPTQEQYYQSWTAQDAVPIQQQYGITISYPLSDAWTGWSDQQYSWGYNKNGTWVYEYPYSQFVGPGLGFEVLTPCFATKYIFNPLSGDNPYVGTISSQTVPGYKVSTINPISIDETRNYDGSYAVSVKNSSSFNAQVLIADKHSGDVKVNVPAGQTVNPDSPDGFWGVRYATVWLSPVNNEQHIVSFIGPGGESYNSTAFPAEYFPALPNNQFVYTFGPYSKSKGGGYAWFPGTNCVGW